MLPDARILVSVIQMARFIESNGSLPRMPDLLRVAGFEVFQVWRQRAA